jgi:glycosyltransferase involved in cell wall biosynthesis
VIGNGVDAERFRFRDPLPPRARLGVPEAALVILSVGHLTERKGFHLLLRAFAALDRADALLVIAGDGPQRQELLELAASLGVDGRVRFPGAVDNAGLPDWYNAADLFVLASSREGWPNVLCEAQASGLPAVATAVWGIPEIIRHDTLGVLVHERTPEGLLAGIREALGRSWDRQAIAAVGCSRTWEAVSGQLESVFQAARAEK